MALATVDDLEGRLGRDLTGDELVRATAILDDVSASVILYAGQTFTTDETTQRFKIRNGVVRLSQRPVVGVSAVVDLNENDVAYEWDQADRLDVTTQVFDSWSMEPYRNGLKYVDVTYEHGYEIVPQVIVGVVSNIALRTLGQTPTESGVVSEEIDGYAYRLGSAAGSGGFGMLPDEKATLDRYRRQLGNIRVA